MKRGGSSGKHLAERDRRIIREHIVFDAVPDTEQVCAIRLQDALRLRVALGPIWKEHGAELAADGVERSVVEGQGQRIRLTPGNTRIFTLSLHRDGKHRFVEVGRNIADVW
jgi:hypothetical protein